MKKLNIAFSAIAAILLFSACKKDDNTPQQKGQVLLVNASPDTSAYDFYFNDSKLNTQSINYPSKSGYISLDPKTYTVKVTATNTINPVVTNSFNVQSGKSYSFFAYDTATNNNKNIKSFVVEDDLTLPTVGKAKVRFFHLSPASVNVDILANNNLLFGNRSYADNVNNNTKSSFVEVNADTYIINVKLANSGDGIPALLSLPNIKLEDRKIYTIFAKGKVDGNGTTALGVEIITHN